MCTPYGLGAILPTRGFGGKRTAGIGHVAAPTLRRGARPWLGAETRKPRHSFECRGLRMRSLAVTYSGMACGHTTIGAERFHFRVRNGIGWFPLAIAARRNRKFFVSTPVASANRAGR